MKFGILFVVPVQGSPSTSVYDKSRQIFDITSCDSAVVVKVTCTIKVLHRNKFPQKKTPLNLLRSFHANDNNNNHYYHYDYYFIINGPPTLILWQERNTICFLEFVNPLASWVICSKIVQHLVNYWSSKHLTFVSSNRVEKQRCSSVEASWSTLEVTTKCTCSVLVRWCCQKWGIAINRIGK